MLSGMHWKGENTAVASWQSRSQAERAGHESPRKDCRRPHQTVSVNRLFPVCSRSRQGHNSAIFVVRQLYEKCLAANKRLFMAFVEFEKAFHRVMRRWSGGRWEKLVWSGLCDWCRGMYANEQSRLRWYGHVERSNDAVKTAFDIQVDGKRGPGRPKMTWKQLTETKCRKWKLSAIDPHDRHTWSSGVRSACVQQASYLEGGPLMWMLPLFLHVNQKSDDDEWWY